MHGVSDVASERGILLKRMRERQRERGLMQRIGQKMQQSVEMGEKELPQSTVPKQRYIRVRDMHIPSSVV